MLYLEPEEHKTSNRTKNSDSEMSAHKRGSDEPQVPQTRKSRRTLVDSDEEDEEDDDPALSSSQASTGDSAFQTALSDLFGESEGSDGESSDHANGATGEQASDLGDDELAGITASTKIDQRRQSARVVSHIKHLRQVRDDAKKQDRFLAKLEKKHAKNRQRRAAELKKVRTFNLSITLEWPGSHIPESVFYSFSRWLAQRSEWWAVAYERGPTCGFWHLQSAAIIDDVSIQAIKSSWHAFVGWDVQRPPVRRVNFCLKELQGRGLHTQVGMLGYTRKDCDKYDGHIWACSPAITEEECSEADLVYVQFGKGDKGMTCVLTEANLIDRAIIYYKRFIKCPASADLECVLTEMLRTGRYSIHGRFFTHNGAFNYGRAQLAFLSRVAPKDTSTDDTRKIFFMLPKPVDDTAFTTPETRRNPTGTDTGPDFFADGSTFVPFNNEDGLRSCESPREPGANTDRHLPSSSSKLEPRCLDFAIDKRPIPRPHRPVCPDAVIEAIGDTTNPSDRPHRDPRVADVLRAQPVSDFSLLQGNSLQLRDDLTNPESFAVHHIA